MAFHVEIASLWLKKILLGTECFLECYRILFLQRDYYYYYYYYYLLL